MREFYLDKSIGNLDLRLGKQQVVWGRADGIKLLDIVNPTDFRELVQNTFEDSRIPVLMVKAETLVGESGEIQAIVSQAKKNVIPGLNDGSAGARRVNYNDPLGQITGTPTPSDNSLLIGSDAGHPFILKGVDTMTGRVNGFQNIGGAMGAVTTTFAGVGFTNPAQNPNAEFFTVGAYTAGSFVGDPTSQAFCAAPAPGGISGAACLENFTELTNQNITNLIDADPVTGAGWDPTQPNSTWEFMPNATFATFNAFVGMDTKYRTRNPDLNNPNLGLRFGDSLDNGLNFSLNYLYAYDPNPVVNINWEDPNTGERLQVVENTTNAGTRVIQLRNAAGGFYGAPVSDASFMTSVTPGVNAAGPARLVFEERLKRVHNIGASFDYALDFESLPPVVLRGEFLYKKDVHSPIVDRAALGYGNLNKALRTEEGDFFNYVLGAEINIFANLLVSGQFIQFRNLDYIDEGGRGSLGTKWRYTGDPATMHLSNELDRARENKEFYSLFLSKPFGPSQEHRWNNITIFEEGGGWWNRFDVEYLFFDELVGMAEFNLYWGDSDDTMFGQFNKSSNVQVGLKYIFE